MRALMLFTLAALGTVGCSSNVTPGDGGDDGGGSNDGTADAQALDVAADVTTADGANPDTPTVDGDHPSGWVSRMDTYVDAQLREERVVYRSGDLEIQGQVCRPIANGPHPIVVFNHGGFSGLTNEWANDGSTCRGGARSGYVVVESSYRGEDGSQGSVEVCLGEADDSLALLNLVRAEPYVDPSRVAIVGGSHGGCITLRMVQRGAPAQVAVDFFGPTDWAAEFAFWQQSLPTAPAGWGPIYQSLIDQLRTSTGGTPDQVPAEYARRSPLTFQADVTASPASLIILHGGADPLVPVAQSCALVAGAGAFENYHLDGTQQETAAVPAGCESYGLAFQSAPRPLGSWPGARYLVVYDGQGHGFDGPGGMQSISDYINYLLARFPPR